MNQLRKRIKQRMFLPLELWIEKKLQLSFQMNEFINAPKEKLSSFVEAQTDIHKIVEEFQLLGVKVVEENISILSFQRWMKQYPQIVAHYSKQESVMIEKLLEHYFVFKYLDLKNSDVYMDIASAGSPFDQILRQYNFNAYSQDLIFKDKIDGFKIGGDASSMPISNNFADVLSLQCAFECFQGNSDIGFIKEASRVLKKDGRLGIAPLYMDKEYFIKTGPKCDKRKIKTEKEANWIWRDDNYLHEPFSRHYSVSAFKTRVIDQLIDMKGEVIYFTNLDELMKEFDGQRIYCHFMFRAFKQ